MSDHTERYMDKWLKYAAIIGPFLGFIFGIGSGTIIAYQAYKQDHTDITLLFNWNQSAHQRFSAVTWMITQCAVILSTDCVHNVYLMGGKAWLCNRHGAVILD